MFYVTELVNLNKKVANGNIVNKSSLDFALSSIRTKSWFDQLAYLVRALLIDHVFEDGNKRTAAFLIISYCTEYKIGFDSEKITKVIINITSKNTNNISKIKRMIKNVIR